MDIKKITEIRNSENIKMKNRAARTYPKFRPC